MPHRRTVNFIKKIMPHGCVMFRTSGNGIQNSAHHSLYPDYVERGCLNIQDVGFRYIDSIVEFIQHHIKDM